MVLSSHARTLGIQESDSVQFCLGSLSGTLPNGIPTPKMPPWVDSKCLEECCHPVAAQGHGSPLRPPGTDGQLPNSRPEPQIFPSFWQRQTQAPSKWSPLFLHSPKPTLPLGIPSSLPGFPCASRPQPLTISHPTVPAPSRS